MKSIKQRIKLPEVNACLQFTDVELCRF